MTQLDINTVSIGNGRSVRLRHLDWLRALVVFMLIFYHSSAIFLNFPWFINNVSSSNIAEAFSWLLDQFQMPLLFTIAGVAAWFSLGRRTGKKFFIERIWRLFIPLVFCMLILNVIMNYASFVYNNHGLLVTSSFLTWYRTYITTKFFPWQKSWSPGVLWFVWYLLIYTIVLLPVLIILRKNVSSNIWLKIGEFFEKQGMLIFLFALAFMPVFVELYPPPNFSSGFQVFYFIFFFLYGFFLYSSEHMQRCIDKFGFFALITGIVSVILVMLLIFPAQSSSFFGPAYWRVFGSNGDTIGQTLYLILRGISCWFTIVGLIYLARKFLDFSNRFLRYANEIVLPFYLLHATYIVAIGYYVISWNMSILAKFVIIVLSSLAATLATIELFRQFNVTRFLLGMRLKNKLAKRI